MLVGLAALIQVALAHDVVRAQLLVALVFLLRGLEVDPGLGELVAGADVARGDGGDAGAFGDGGAFRESAEADDAFAPGDDAHLISGRREDLSAGADDLAEGAGGDAFHADAQLLLALGADLDPSVVVFVGFFFVFVFGAARLHAATVDDGTQGHQGK